MIWGVPLLVSYHFAFSYCSWGSQARIPKWFAIPFSSGPHSVRPLHHDPPVLGCPTGMAWFHCVRQDCGPSVIRLTSFLWVWFQCVCPLMPSCNTYRLTWVSLTLDVGLSPYGCSSKVQPLLLTLDEGYLLTTTPPYLESGIAPLGPPAPTQPPLLGCGVAPALLLTIPHKQNFLVIALDS